jgi:hypothetical protein
VNGLIYLIGSLRNPNIPTIGNELRQRLKIDVFDDWHAGGPEADDQWQRYERERGHNYREAITGRHAAEIFDIDFRFLNSATCGVLVMPAGRSGHLELGYLRGQGKPVYILFDAEPERFDLMYRFCQDGYGVHFSLESLVEDIKNG